MWQLTYDDGETKVRRWKGEYDTLVDRLDTLVHAFDWAPEFFTLKKLRG